MRRPVTVASIAVIVSFVLVPAVAGDAPAAGEKVGEPRSPAGLPAGFRLQSELVTRDERVATALELVATQPNDASAWQVLGTALADVGDHPDAIAAFERGVRLDRDNADLWSDLGAAELRADRAGAATGSLRKAISIEPFHGRAHYNLGLAHSALGHYDAALEAFETALLIEPALGDPRKNPGAANNPHLDLVKLRVYMKTGGAAPALFGLADD